MIPFELYQIYVLESILLSERTSSFLPCSIPIITSKHDHSTIQYVHGRPCRVIKHARKDWMYRVGRS